MAVVAARRVVVQVAVFFVRHRPRLLSTVASVIHPEASTTAASATTEGIRAMRPFFGSRRQRNFALLFGVIVGEFRVVVVDLESVFVWRSDSVRAPLTELNRLKRRMTRTWPVQLAESLKQFGVDT